MLCGHQASPSLAASGPSGFTRLPFLRPQLIPGPVIHGHPKMVCFHELRPGPSPAHTTTVTFPALFACGFCYSLRLSWALIYLPPSLPSASQTRTRTPWVGLHLPPSLSLSWSPWCPGGAEGVRDDSDQGLKSEHTSEDVQTFVKAGVFISHFLLAWHLLPT